jgi:AI-2 transport protein TqsA
MYDFKTSTLSMNLYKATSLLIIFCLTLGLLIIGKDFLIPIVIAIGAWFLFNALANMFEKLKIGGNSAPLWLRYIFASITIGLFVYIVVLIVNTNIADLQGQMGFYEQNFKNFELLLKEKLGMENVNMGSEFIERFSLENILGSVLESISSLVSSTVLIVIYLIFMLLEQHMFGEKIRQIFKGNHSIRVAQNMQKIKQTVESYILLKTLISILTGFLSYIIMLVIGVDFALFWAFLIFLLNYIPNIGSIIATIFPALLSLVQFESIVPAMIVFFGIGAIQFMIGNFIEPRVFGKSLNMSALAVVLSLTFWGFVWGIAGMFLCVPITVVIMIILNNFEETKPIAVLLSDNGQLDQDN